MSNQPDDFQLRKPRGRQLFEPFKPLLNELARTIAFGVVIMTGSLAMVVAQASSPDYHALFRQALSLTLAHVALSAAYFRYARDRIRWLGLLMAVLSVVSLVEFALRLFLGIRLFG